jgi:hypothetical protein
VLWTGTGVRKQYKGVRLRDSGPNNRVKNHIAKDLLRSFVLVWIVGFQFPGGLRHPSCLFNEGFTACATTWRTAAEKGGVPWKRLL